MARPLRIDYPETYYHVLSRGNEQRPIFKSDKDYAKFLELLEKTVSKFHIEIHAYVLMRNHYHLLVKTTKDGNLSRAIQWLGVTYAGWYNKRYKRSGHLFQGRFKSFLVEDESYFTAMCYYIHGNPVRVGVAKTPEEFPYGSARTYADKDKEPVWLTTEVMLMMAGGSRKNFCAEQAAYLSGSDSPLKDLRHGVYLGSEEYGQRCAEMARGEPVAEKPQKRMLLRHKDKQELARWILTQLGEGDIEGQLKPGKKPRLGRDMSIYLMSQFGSYTHTEIGEVYGVGYTAITGIIKRVEERLEKDKRQKRLAGKILQQII
ncbi:MAG: transposase [Deltaproteobacteria bacterium]|nr:transposase [Deltaproteobacteria bacterium]